MLGTTPTVLEILVKAEVDDGFEFMTSMSLFRGAAVPAKKIYYLLIIYLQVLITCQQVRTVKTLRCLN